MPDDIDIHAAAVMAGVRDNLLKPMHDSIVSKSAELTENAKSIILGRLSEFEVNQFRQHEAWALCCLS